MVPNTDPVAATDSSLIESLRAGDEAAFVWLVGTYHSSFVRVARGHVSSDAVAEEVAQEAWLGVGIGIDRFQCRSSLKTWMFRILLNIARSRGVRDQRCIPLSALTGEDETRSDEAQLMARSSATSVGWLDPTSSGWEGIPEDRAEAAELREVLTEAIVDLPAAQVSVIVLRDVENFSAAEVCSLLDITQGNQRILLHRARGKVRKLLTTYFESREPQLAATSC